MANTRAQPLIDYYASTLTLQDPHLHHGRIRFKSATLEVAAADAANRFYRFFRVRAHDVPLRLEVSHDALGAGFNDSNWGVRTPPNAADPTADPVQIAAQGDNCLADAYDATAATAAGPASILFAGTTGIDEQLAYARRNFWQLALGVAGVEPAPGTEYELICQAISEPAAAGTLTCVLWYTAGD